VARGIADLILLKNRNGAIGRVKTRWEGRWQGFDNLDDSDGEIQHDDD
jgi:replicative DNA helicase